MVFHITTLTPPLNPKTLSLRNPKTSIKPLNFHSLTLSPPLNSNTYALVLDQCENSKFGKQIHAHYIKNGFNNNSNNHVFISTKLLQMYVKCGCFEHAAKVFDAMTVKNLYAYIAAITLCLNYGLYEDAFGLYKDLMFKNLEFEFFLFPIVLKICFGFGGIVLGRQLHGVVIKKGFFVNLYVCNALIDMYGKCGSLVESKSVFNVMHEKDNVSWNSMFSAYMVNGMVEEALGMIRKMWDSKLMPNFVTWSVLIGGFSQNGYYLEAIEMLYRMGKNGFVPNAQVLASVLPSCARLKMSRLGEELHGYITRYGFIDNPIVVNGLLDVYRKCNDMGSARKIFSEYSEKNVFSFNTMIVGYCEDGEIYEAKKLFDEMEKQGMKRDVISWNSMISGYVDNFMFEEALYLFMELLVQEGISINSFTLGSVLTACTEMGFLRLGNKIHSQAIVRGLQSDPFVGRALMEMYCYFGDLNAAHKAFTEVLEKDIPTWNTLISSYAHCNEVDAIPKILQKMREDGFDPTTHTWNTIIMGHIQNGRYELAFQLFSEIQASNLRTDIYTIGIILPACSRLATIERGKQVHAHSIRFGYESDVHIGASLVDMYGKCGNINYAENAFYKIKRTCNLIGYNAMLSAYAMYGLGLEGISLFRSLLGSGFNPDSVTFLSVLSLCVHLGAVETGREVFNLMGEYNVKPMLKHYTCIVDLLSRAGHIEEAYKVLNDMPMEPDSVICGALLGGCVGHCHVDVGEKVAKKLITSEPDNTANYVMLANLYASAGRWSDLARTRKLMRQKQMQKDPGCSWIEVKYETHVFVASDTSHVRTEEIHAALDQLTTHMRTEFRICM